MRQEPHLSRRSSISVAAVFLALALCGRLHAQTTYHASPIGDDRNDGKSPATAWRTVARVNSQSLQPGDHVLFERGSEWRECPIPNSGGTADRSIVFGAYGGGWKPKFWGSDVLDKAGF